MQQFKFYRPLSRTLTMPSGRREQGLAVAVLGLALAAGFGWREHVGIVWYERTVFLPMHWLTQRIVLFVGSANHHAVVWINGNFVGEHEGGHLPFHLPLEQLHLNFGRPNRLTIAVNNTLSTTTIPPGIVQVNAAGRRIQRLQMDFFNYAGLHRQVLLYTTPLVAYLDDILVSCRLEGAVAHLNVFVSAASTEPPPPPGAVTGAAASSVLITLRDAADQVVARGRMPSDPRRGGRLQVHDAQHDAQLRGGHATCPCMHVLTTAPSPLPTGARRAALVATLHVRHARLPVHDRRRGEP